MQEVKQESLFISVGSEQLHLRRIWSNDEGEPVFMVHGSIENGKIFYTENGKGYAPFLARHGYDVFVADLRGRGLSTPAISKHSKHGLSEILKEDFPAYLNKIEELKGNMPQHWVSHSWGGNMLLADYARNHEQRHVASMVFFATKRRISIRSFKKIQMLDLGWLFLGKILMAIKGYFPAKEFGIGSDNETIGSHRETSVWIKEKKWMDWDDGFDYASALKSLNLPPILSLTGAGDAVLGHPIDVKLLLNEIGNDGSGYHLLGKASGNQHNYDHINILTHKDAVNDHFPKTVEFMKKAIQP